MALLLYAGEASAHSLEPYYRIVRFIQGETQFQLTAINAFDYMEAFRVEVWTDDSFQEPITDFKSVPDIIYLGPNSSRQFSVQIFGEPSSTSFLVCTATDLAGGATRVCSRIFTCPSTASNAECKSRVRNRRNSNLARDKM